MTITYKNDDYNLYSLVLKEAEKMYVLPILSKMEKWRLKAEIKINLIKEGFLSLWFQKVKEMYELIN